MVYKFRILSDEIKDFARELIINSDQTFLDFHHCLQEDLDYDPKQLASFFITNTLWEKQLQITLIDMMDEEGGNCISMDKAKLGTHLSKQGQRMLYVFDFFSERSFFIELTEIISSMGNDSLPKITFSHGLAPIQIDLGFNDTSFLEAGLDDDLSLGSYDDELSDPDLDFFDSEDFSDD
jgi:hypothetical protein